jgi:chromosome segregation ATPase
MSEENAGQGTLDTTLGTVAANSAAITPNAEPSSAPTGQTPELSKELAEARLQIERLKGTQAANDRALAARQAQIDKLVAQAAEYEGAVKARDESLSLTVTELADLKTKTAELDNLQAQVAAAQYEVERLKVVAEYSAQNPMIAVLAKTGALPQAETLDDFRKGLDAIVSSMGGIAQQAIVQTLTGARKPPAPVENDVASMQEEATRLIRAGRDEEAYELWRKVMALQA